MFWGDKIIDEFIDSRKEKIDQGETIIVRDEKTISGHPHVGSLRSFVMHATFSDVLTDRGVKHRNVYELNDTDAFDSVPHYVPAEWKEHLGKRLKDVPSPDGKAENYAKYFAQFYTNALEDEKYNVEFYWNSEPYEAGQYDKYIRLAIEHRHDIRKIYKEVSGGEKPETWYPVQVICDACGKIANTKISEWDGEELTYSCTAKTRYNEGCGHEGKKSPFGGNATLPWKVEWAAKFCVQGVDIEGAGKDHYAAGGSRHISNRICEEIFGMKPHPFDVRHEFILIEGAKMSSSAGAGMTVQKLHDLMIRYLFRFMMIYKDIMKTINFSPDGDTIPVLFDTYDGAMRHYLMDQDSEDRNADQARLIELTHFYEPERNLDRYLPRFSQVAFLVQVPHLDMEEKVAEMKGAPLTDADKEELQLRAEMAKYWLEHYSPERYQFKIQEDEIPESVSELSAEQKDLLGKIAEFLNTQGEKVDGEALHAFLHDLKRESGCQPRDLFGAIYHSIFGRPSGPKAGFLLSTLDKEWLTKRFQAVANS